MTGDIIIDGKDAYTEWGVILADGGLKELVCLPPLKDYPKNDWFEKDGIVADLSAPVLNTREMTLKFVSRGDFNAFEGFMEYLAAAAQREYRFRYVDKIFSLRLVSFSSLETAYRIGRISVKLADDSPLKNYAYLSPTGGGVASDDGWRLDGARFTDYGIRVVGGFEEMINMGAVKPALLRNIGTKPGAIYDTGASVRFKSRDFKLQCVLRANGAADMWRNWYAFAYDLTRPDKRTLRGSKSIGSVETATVRCCYKSCSVSEFAISAAGRPWMKFNLTLTRII